MNKKMLSMITALTIAAGVLGTAAASSLPANLGTPAIGSTMNRFNYSVTTGAVTGVGIPAGTTSAWMLGLPLDTSGLKTVTVTSRATSALGAPRWRVTASNPFGTVLSATAFVNIPVSAVFVAISRNINVPANGVCSIDARLNTGARILRAAYAPN